MGQATHGKERLGLLELCGKPRLPRAVQDSPPSTSLANPEQEPQDVPLPLSQGVGTAAATGTSGLCPAPN